MSAEKISSSEQKKFSTRVDINDLLARVRKENSKKNKVNLVFFGLFSFLILIVGLLLTL
tara:strand:+ start:138 stop:314 length:177 start_codon:yes stop_codon:yes gene_type:complete